VIFAVTSLGSQDSSIYFPIGSSSESFPFSANWTIAVEVNILFIEPRLNFVSMVFGALKSLLALPNAAEYSTLPSFASNTEPEKASTRASAVTYCCSALASSASLATRGAAPGGGRRSSLVTLCGKASSTLTCNAFVSPVSLRVRRMTAR
jgi:hypothetical protein